MKRAFNFNAGPAILPVSVLEEASKGVLEIGNSGMSILEVSHRGELYESIHNDTKARILKLLGLSESEYSVLFLGGGASTQFMMLPMNFLKADTAADYVHTGEWSSKAFKEAKRYGKVTLAGSSEADKFASIPTVAKPSAGAAYYHITTNNTIEGTEFASLPDTGSVPLIGDLSSEFMSRQLDYKKFAMIYAGAQKNAGPAGVTVVVMRNNFLEQAFEDVPSMMSYKVHAKNNSLYNTPPVFSIYVVNLVAKWVESQGGIAGVQKTNEKKAAMIYSALDEYADVYDIVVKKPADRSKMNITWRMKNPDSEKAFLKGAEEKMMLGLKGHRSVGGLRASIYNAFPEEGAAALATYLKEFAKR
jgi:phosphoserine aminotransferase